MNKAYQNMIPFAYVLLETYKRLHLSEEETLLALMIDHLIESGNSFINADLLSLKMTEKPEAINALLNDLLKKGFLSYPLVKGKMSTSIEGLKNQAYGEFSKIMEEQRRLSIDPKNAEAITRLNAFFEEKLERSLSPLERDSLSDFLTSYSEEEIRNALLDALRSGKRTMRAVGAELKSNRKEADLMSEGSSAINEEWDQNIQDTMDGIRKIWGKKM